MEVTRSNGRRTTQSVVTEELANEIADHVRRKMAGSAQTVGEAIEMFLAELKSRKCKESHIDSSKHRLNFLFPRQDRVLGSLCPTVCQMLYDDLEDRRKKNGAEYSVDYKRNSILAGRAMCKWLVKASVLSSNPFEGIDGVGKRKRGKKQLTIDESRKFLATCLAVDDIGATAALCCLVLAMRCGEIVGLTGRSIDDNGRIVRIDEAKTAAGVRLIEVPEMMRDRMPALAAANIDRHWINREVHRMCALAGVEDVGPHALRGTHASLATRAGATSQLVADTLGHASTTVTTQHYTQATAVSETRSHAALTVLAGGLK